MRRASRRTGGARWVATLAVTTWGFALGARAASAAETAAASGAAAFVAAEPSVSYVVVGADGSTVPFDISFGAPATTTRRGSTPRLALSAPVVGGAPGPHASDYWLVAADGG